MLRPVTTMSSSPRYTARVHIARPRERLLRCSLCLCPSDVEHVSAPRRHREIEATPRQLRAVSLVAHRRVDHITQHDGTGVDLRRERGPYIALPRARRVVDGDEQPFVVALPGERDELIGARVAVPRRCD